MRRRPFHAEHAFRLTAANGTSRFGRYRFVPQAGEAFLDPEEAGKRSPSFLREELEGRLRTGPAAFRLVLQLAEAGDPTDDVTALWPESRSMVELGRLDVTSISPTSGEDERRLIFDPTNGRKASISRPIRSCWPGRPLTASPTSGAGRVSERAVRGRQLRSARNLTDQQSARAHGHTLNPPLRGKVKGLR
jgi:hypothetical protein